MVIVQRLVENRRKRSHGVYGIDFQLRDPSADSEAQALFARYECRSDISGSRTARMQYYNL